MRTAAIRSLLRASGRDDAAWDPSLLVADLRTVDGANGAPIPEVRMPADLGRTLRVEVELIGAEPEAAARIVRLRLRADTGAGPSNPIVASASRIVPARALDLRSYATEDRPVVALDWTIAQVPGAIGLAVEVDERRLSPLPCEAADALLTTELSALDPLMSGLPHYDLHYATYGVELGSIRIR